MEEQKIFTVDDLFALWQPTSRVPWHLSPDGSILSISVQNARKGKDVGLDQSYTKDGIPNGMIGSRVLLVDTLTGQVNDPFPQTCTSWGAQWSPDGMRCVAYVCDQGQLGLGVWERASEAFHFLQPIDIHPFFGFEVPAWASDSQSVIVKLVATQERDQQASPMMDENEEKPPVVVFSFIPGSMQEQNTESPLLPGWASGYLCDLVCVDVTTGAISPLVTNWRIIGWKAAPLGDAVAIFRYTDVRAKLQQFYFDLTIVPLNGNPARVLARHIPQSYGICFSWSPNSRSLAYTAGESGAKSQLFVVAADGTTDPRELSPAGEDLELSQEYEVPRWSEDGASLYCLGKRGCWEFAVDGSRHRLVAVVSECDLLGWIQPPTLGTLWMPQPEHLLYLVQSPGTKKVGFALVPLYRKEQTRLTELPGQPVMTPFAMEAAPHTAKIYLLMEESDRPAEVWQLSVDQHTHCALCILNPQLNDVALGTSRLLDYLAWDGTRQQATVLLPPGYTEGQKVPVIVEVYGGDLPSNNMHSFGISQSVLHGQVLASHGYAILYPDMPLKELDPLKQLPGLVLPAVHRLIDMGIADAQHIGLMGQSYGGYCTLALLTQTSLFSAAVACAGFSDLVSTYLSMRENGLDSWLGWCESGQGRMRGPLWEKRDAYIENSPIFYLDRIQTPILLIHGSEDGVPRAQAEAVFVGLRRLGKPVELRRYSGEGHWPGRWNERSYRDLSQCVIAWFDLYLQ